MAFDLFAKKDIATLHAEAAGEGAGEARLARTLGPFDLLALGVGAIIGAGIFVLTGSAAARYAGPAITLSFLIAAVACAFAGLCYAEFASLIPVAGSAYTYGYASLGEIRRLGHRLGSHPGVRVRRRHGRGGLERLRHELPPGRRRSPPSPAHGVARDELVLWHDRWERLETIRPRLDLEHVDAAQLTHAFGSFDLVAMLAILAITVVLVVGVRESANFNTFIVAVKLAIVLSFIALVTGALAKANWAPLAKNWHPYIPPNTGEFGKYGWSGILRGSAVIFFAYIGFDAVSTAAQEAKTPKRDMPIGILGSLVICTILYVLVSGLLTGIVPYTALNVPDPVAVGIDATGITWGSHLVKVGAIFGLTSVMLVMLLGQSRVFFSMASDGLLWKWAGKVHPRFKTPYVSSIAVGLFVAFFAALIPIDILGELVSIGTLLAFVIVSASVWLLRRRQPDMPRPFKTPWVPFVPIMGMLVPLAMMLALPAATWLRLAVWLAVGMVVYFTYSRKHSKVQAARASRP